MAGEEAAAMTLTLQEVLHRSVGDLRARVGFDDASVMAFDPDALLPIAFATAWPRHFHDSEAACRNEQVEADVHKFRDLARAPVKAAALSAGDPLTAGSPRWDQLLRPAGHRHELRAALTDELGRCWGAVSMVRNGRRAFSQAAWRRSAHGADPQHDASPGH
jgi:hypothetical protein